SQRGAAREVCRRGCAVIQFKCACCNQLLQLGDEWAGKVAKCPYSGQFMQVPSAPAPAPTPAPPRQSAPPAPVQPLAPTPARAPVAPVPPVAPREVHNPFAAGAFVTPTPGGRARSAGPTGAEFGAMTGTVSQATQQQTAKKSQEATWRLRGTLL